MICPAPQIVCGSGRGRAHSTFPDQRLKHGQSYLEATVGGVFGNICQGNIGNPADFQPILGLEQVVQRDVF